jgi:hypothetical protein
LRGLELWKKNFCEEGFSILSRPIREAGESGGKMHAQNFLCFGDYKKCIHDVQEMYMGIKIKEEEELP